MKQTDVVIIGGGPAGLAAAIWCKRLGLDHLLLESRASIGGQLQFIHNPIIDYPAVVAANGAELRQMLAQHVANIGCNVELRAHTVSVDASNKEVIYKQDGEEYGVTAKAVILATGARDRPLGVPGEEEMIERGEVYSASRDSEHFRGRPVAVIGGGDRALEGALILAESGASVYLIHRSSDFRARTEFQLRTMSHPYIRLIQPAHVTAIDGNTRTEAVKVETKDGLIERLEVDAVFIRIGVEPSSEIIRGQALLDEHGFVITDPYGCTSTNGLYAVGDVCTPPAFSSIAHATGQGMVTAKRIYEQLKERM